MWNSRCSHFSFQAGTDGVSGRPAACPVLQEFNKGRDAVSCQTAQDSMSSNAIAICLGKTTSVLTLGKVLISEHFKISLHII